MFENDFIIEFNDEELGDCRTYPETFKGYEQAIKDLKLYKAKQNQRIAELEEQLKEKSARIEELEGQFAYECECNKQFVECQKENEELKQQLVEKQKEIISLECVISEIHNDIKELHEFKVGDDEYDLTDSDARFSLQCDLLNNEQDKILFAVEKLTEIRDYVKNCWSLDTTEGKVRLDVAKKIRLKIEELKRR